MTGGIRGPMSPEKTVDGVVLVAGFAVLGKAQEFDIAIRVVRAAFVSIGAACEEFVPAGLLLSGKGVVQKSVGVRGHRDIQTEVGKLLHLFQR